VAALHQLYLRGLKVVTNARVIGLRPGWIVSTTQGDFDAKVVVNAAGAWGDVIASLAGVPAIGLQAKRRSAFTFDTPIEARGWPMVIDRDERFYFKPEGHRILASPANQEPVPPQDASPDELDIALGVDRLQQCTTLRVDRIFRKWAGLRTFAPGRPLVCDFAAPGLFFFLGQGGSGIKIAPAAARLAAAIIVGNGVPAELLEAGFDVGTVRYSPI